jgi:hypothetical protein
LLYLEIGISQLKDIVINMQTQLIGTLHILLGGAGTYDSLISTSDSSRANAVRALVDQFQRLSVAIPVSSIASGNRASGSGWVVMKSDAHGKVTRMRDNLRSFRPIFKQGERYELTNSNVTGNWIQLKWPGDSRKFVVSANDVILP